MRLKNTGDNTEGHRGNNRTWKFRGLEQIR